MKQIQEFRIGDAVYYNKGTEIGIITDADKLDDGSISYRIDYCQDKDLETGRRGGNGPIWRKGYPKPVTEPADILFVFGVKELERARFLEHHLKIANENLIAIKRLIRQFKEES